MNWLIKTNDAAVLLFTSMLLSCKDDKNIESKSEMGTCYFKSSAATAPATCPKK